jgi:hypothetical protein
MATAKKQILIGTLATVFGAAIIGTGVVFWKHRKVVRRRIAQAQRKQLPPGTATPRGQQAAHFLATLSKEQKSRILDALGWLQKLSLAALDENDPLEVYSFWEQLDPKQREVVRETLTPQQMTSLQSVLRAGREAKHGQAGR